MSTAIALLRNPFELYVVENTRQSPPCDVPELHAKPFARCLQSLSQVREAAARRQPQASASLVVQGAAGSGKSHLVTRLRHHFRTERRVIVVGIRLATTASRLWRFVRQELVRELMHDEPDLGGGNALTRLLRQRFPNWDPAQTRSVLGGVLGSGLPQLRQLLDALDPSQTDVDRTVRTALGVLYDNRSPQDQGVARDWLRGGRVSAEAAGRIGLGGDESADGDDDLEAEAKAVVMSIARLAGREVTLCICFDQVEGLQVTAKDRDSLRLFANAVTELTADDQSALLAVTFCRSDVLADLRGATSTAIWQRLAAVTVAIPPLTWPLAVELYRRRVAAAYRAVNEQPPDDDPYAPLGETFLRQAFDAEQYYTPRQLLLDCAKEFERTMGGFPPVEEPTDLPPTTPPGPAIDPGPTTPLPTPPAPRPTPTAIDPLAADWSRRRKQALQSGVSGEAVDTVFGLGLPWLLEVMGSPFAAETNKRPKEFGDITMRFFPDAAIAGGTIGMSVCTQNPKSVVFRLKRLREQLGKAQKSGYFAELVIVRAADAEVGTAGKKLLDELSVPPSRVLRPDCQQLAELSAFQSMYTDAQNDRLILGNTVYTVGRLTEWAASQNLPSGVRGLLHQLFGPRLAAVRQPVADPGRPR